jgi:isopenicillin N synthase-like dioxygenase
MAPQTVRAFQAASRLMSLGRLNLETGLYKAPLRRCFASVTRNEHLGSTMPPNSKAKVGNLQTFSLPDRVTGSTGDRALGKAIVDACRRDGILQVEMTPAETKLADEAFTASKAFFNKPHAEKAACIDSQSYAGYIASGEEITDGVADYSEIFTVTKDLDLAEPRVQKKWPCHGPTPWPDIAMKAPMAKYMDQLGQAGERLLQLIECGLGVEPSSLTKYTEDGWHHMRVLRYGLEILPLHRIQKSLQLKRHADSQR